MFQTIMITFKVLSTCFKEYYSNTFTTQPCNMMLTIFMNVSHLNNKT